MLTYYLDTSAWVKRYIEEPGSARVTQLFDSEADYELLTCELAWVELRSALSRRLRERSVSQSDIRHAIASSEKDCLQRIALVSLNLETIQRAGELVFEHPLRAYDALHLATALDLKSMRLPSDDEGFRFLSSDLNLTRAAQACGLTAEIPL